MWDSLCYINKVYYNQKRAIKVKINPPAKPANTCHGLW